MMYLETRNRPDIPTAVSMLGKFQADPGLKQWRCLKEILRYLINSTNYGIDLPKGEGKVEVRAYSDEDWAHDLRKRRSR